MWDTRKGQSWHSMGFHMHIDPQDTFLSLWLLLPVSLEASLRITRHLERTHTDCWLQRWLSLGLSRCLGLSGMISLRRFVPWLVRIAKSVSSCGSWNLDPSMRQEARQVIKKWVSNRPCILHKTSWKTNSRSLQTTTFSAHGSRIRNLYLLRT